jgi:lipopolysaccharide export LptBFGC system permease protein LptF
VELAGGAEVKKVAGLLLFLLPFGFLLAVLYAMLNMRRRSE